MQQVKGFLQVCLPAGTSTLQAQLLDAALVQGERNYAKLEGGTGPLVYPAGHLYLYTWLQSVTGGGSVQAAQGIFAVFYLLSQARLMMLCASSTAVSMHVCD